MQEKRFIERKWQKGNNDDAGMPEFLFWQLKGKVAYKLCIFGNRAPLLHVLIAAFA